MPLLSLLMKHGSMSEQLKARADSFIRQQNKLQNVSRPHAAENSLQLSEQKQPRATGQQSAGWCNLTNHSAAHCHTDLVQIKRNCYP